MSNLPEAASLKKIDLHIHTVSSDADSDFEFSLDKLVEYVRTMELDCIAVTNHNLFDFDQFQKIQETVLATVFPGIELDLNGGQILVIGPDTNVDSFNGSCQRVTELSPSKKHPVSVDDLKDIFGDLSNYILIPHYQKRPQIQDETLLLLKDYVSAGEVSSPKKFVGCVNEKDRLVPVYFSDSRICDDLAELPVRQTYIDCEEATFAAVRACLRDKNKVALSEADGNSVFPIFDDGQMLSTGLNVIVGERSSGKSYTLDRIAGNFGNSKFIPQFSLVARNKEEDDRRLEKYLSDQNSVLSAEFLSDFRNVVDDVIEIDLEIDLREVENYVDALRRYAEQTEMHDAFSAARLYNEEKFVIAKQDQLATLIESTQNLIENKEFQSVIEAHVSRDALRRLIVALILEYRDRQLQAKKRKWINDVIGDIKAKLRLKSTAPPIPDIDLYGINLNRVRIRKFADVANAVKRAKDIERRSLHSFTIVATASPVKGAGELQVISRTKKKFSDAFGQYRDPYKYLQELKNIEGLELAELHKLFVRIQYKILNSDEFEVSGGEQSEFNLLQQIQDAKKYDMLLIDEPESSFDNLFLKDEVNEIIKDISRTMPVVLVTHNNTIGASIQPDYMLYTSKEVNNGRIEYLIYSGSPTSKHLASVDGRKISTYDVTLGCLEAGSNAYEERRKGYENIKDQ